MVNVCDLFKLNNSNLTKIKSWYWKKPLPNRNDRMISTLSELIMLRRARRRFWVICHWLWAGDFYFLLPRWCRQGLHPRWFIEIQLLRKTAPDTGTVSPLNRHLDITREASHTSHSQEDIEQTLRVALTSERVLLTLRSAESKDNVNIFLILPLMSLRIWVESFEY